MSLNPFARRGSSRVVGALDIGTSKIACLVAQIETDRDGAVGDVRVLGSGVHRSAGVKAGVVTDPQATEGVVRAAVAQAERASGVTLEEVFVSVACGRLKSLNFAAHADIAARRVRDSDITRILEGARSYAERDGRILIHMNRKAYRLDGAPGGDDPRGLAARRLTADIHAVTADEGAIRNLLYVVERCDLAVSGLVAAPVASALGVTCDEQRQLGVTVIDMGGGTTTLAAFEHGVLVHCDVMLAGGHHLTLEIAQNLHAALAEAERIKTLYASVVNAPSDIYDTFCYAGSGDGGEQLQRGTRAQLAGVVRRRVELQLGELGERMSASGLANGPVVITGGASQLAGLAGFAGQLLGRDVTIAVPPERLLPLASAGAAGLTTASGLLLAGAAGEAIEAAEASGSRFGYLSRVGRWVRDGL